MLDKLEQADRHSLEQWTIWNTDISTDVPLVAHLHREANMQSLPETLKLEHSALSLTITLESK